MEEITCQACRGTIENEDRQCPYCGIKIKRELPESLVLTALLLVGFCAALVAL